MARIEELVENVSYLLTAKALVGKKYHRLMPFGVTGWPTEGIIEQFDIEHRVNAMRFTRSNVLAIATEGGFEFRDLRGKVLAKRATKGFVSALDVDYVNDRVIFISRLGEVFVTNENGTIEAELEIPEDYAMTVALSERGFIVCGLDGHCAYYEKYRKVWAKEIATGLPVYGQGVAVYSEPLDREYAYVLDSDDGGLRIIDLKTGELKEYYAFGEMAFDGKLTPDSPKRVALSGNRLVVLSDYFLRVYDLSVNPARPREVWREFLRLSGGELAVWGKVYVVASEEFYDELYLNVYVDRDNRTELVYSYVGINHDETQLIPGVYRDILAIAKNEPDGTSTIYIVDLKKYREAVKEKIKKYLIDAYLSRE